MTFFLYFVVNLSCISSSDSFLTQTTYTTGPSLQHWVLRFNNTNTRSLFVICCGSKNSSTLLFSRFQLIDSFHRVSSIKGRDFTEVIILSWHRCLSFVCQCFFLFVSFELIVVGRWCTHNFVFWFNLSLSRFMLSVWLCFREGSGMNKRGLIFALRRASIQCSSQFSYLTRNDFIVFTVHRFNNRE